MFWETLARKMISSSVLADARISMLSVSGDGPRAAIVSSDEAFGVWRTADGKRLGSLGVQDGTLSAVALFEDGTRLPAGFSNGLIKVWDVESQTDLFQLRGHPESIKRLPFRQTIGRLPAAVAAATTKVMPSEVCPHPQPSKPLDGKPAAHIMKLAERKLSSLLSQTHGGEPGSTGCLTRLVACRGWSAGLVKSRP